MRCRRQVWKKCGRIGTWWQNLLSGKLVEVEWKKNMRMIGDDFLELLSLKEPFCRERSDEVRKKGKRVKGRTYAILLKGSGILFDDMQCLWLLKRYYVFMC